MDTYGFVTTDETYDIQNPAFELLESRHSHTPVIDNGYGVFGGNHRHSGLEFETPKPTADQMKEINPYFWGNLNESEEF